MKKYADIISTQYFDGVYDLLGETEKSWKRFIPNENFYDVLYSTLNAIAPDESGTKKSIRLQGTYGTGKSHVTSVIKHLLWDDTDKIADFLNSMEPEAKNRVEAFRKNQKAFPVVLKGSYTISDNRTFNLTLQREVKTALSKAKCPIVTKTDFETWVDIIQNPKFNSIWDEIIANDPELNAFVTNKEELIKALKDWDYDVLEKMEESISDTNLHPVFTNIMEWLKEVVAQLKDGGIADYLVIYWDEFTTIPEIPDVSHDVYQNIAELSLKDNIHLFSVMHRKPRNDDEEKTSDRFNVVEYTMQTITTYDIIEKAINKTDREKWEELKNENVLSKPELINLIKRKIAPEDGTSVHKKIIDMYPLHPYSSYLLTYVAQYIGSANRSVFNFLTSNENGFRGFINDNPNGSDGIYLTPDLLWDYFLPEFEKSEGLSERIVNTYNKNVKLIKNDEESFVPIFKSVLLLNMLGSVQRVKEESDNSLVKPSDDNIHSLFTETEISKSIDGALTYFDEKGIIQRDGWGNFELKGTILDAKKVEEQKAELLRNFDIIDHLEPGQLSNIKSIITRNVLRKTDISFFNANIAEHTLRQRLTNAFKQNLAHLRIAIFLGTDSTSVTTADKMLKKLAKESEYENIIFVLIEETFQQSDFDKYIDHKARADVSGIYEILEEKERHQENARKFIENWLEKIKQHSSKYYFRNDVDSEISNQISSIIRSNLATRIFPYGMEFTPAINKEPIWASGKSKTSVQTMLCSHNKKDINDRGNMYIHLARLLQNSNGDWIVDDKLTITKSPDETHPLVQAHKKVREAINKANKAQFHLGDELSFLSKPPYGYDDLYVNLGALGFLMRDYVNKLYEYSSGSPITETMMVDKIIQLVEYWDTGKQKGSSLEVRFGTIEELKLVKKLNKLFNIASEELGMTKTRWAIQDKVKETGYPLWAFKYSTDNSNIKKAIDEINAMIKTPDKKIDEANIKKLYGSLDAVELDISPLISDVKNARDGFISFIKSIDQIEESDIEGDKLDALFAHIKISLQEEIPLWEEEKIKVVVLGWKIQQQEPPPPTNEDRINCPHCNEMVDKQWHTCPNCSRQIIPETKEEVKTRQSKLIEFTEDWTKDDWARIMQKAVKDYPVILKILSKYKEEE